MRKIWPGVTVRIPFSSLASQAVGPPLSHFEESWLDRTWPAVGKKLIDATPLAYQEVSPDDSVLGSMVDTSGLGLNTTYRQMIKDAFRDEWWNGNFGASPPPEVLASLVVSGPLVTDKSFVSNLDQLNITAQPPVGDLHEFEHMALNFSLFFGLAVQEYEKTLIADDTPFDRFVEAIQGGDPSGGANLTAQELKGLELFVGAGRCINCHRLPEGTNHSIRNLQVNAQGVPQNILEVMPMGNFIPPAEPPAPGVVPAGLGIYDNGFYNIARRPTEEDIARDGESPFTNPELLGTNFPLSYVKLAILKKTGDLPLEVAKYVPDLPDNADVVIPLAGGGTATITVPTAGLEPFVRGSFKSSHIRNLPYNGPYFHDGGDATLRQLVEFYTRGGNFPATNLNQLDPDIQFIPELDPITQTNDNDIQALVAFLSTGLTDQRVVDEKQPFDHPQLFIPKDGYSPNASLDSVGALQNTGEYFEIKAVGKHGLAAAGLPAISTFLGLNPQDSDTSD